MRFLESKEKFDLKYNQVMERKEMLNKKMDFKNVVELGKLIANWNLKTKKTLSSSFYSFLILNR